MHMGHSGEAQEPERNSATGHGVIFSWISYVFRRMGRVSHAERSNTGSASYTSSSDYDRNDIPYSTSEGQQASAKLWGIYIAEADRYDTSLVESWKADMEGMLIFSGLFSASLTAFLIESYRTLQSDSSDMTVHLLAHISQQLAAMSQNASLPSPDPVVFEPTQTSLVCNTLWFLSLSLSLTCALLATLVEQWAREFLHKTQKRPSPIRRARVLSFLYFGIRRFGMHTVVDVIPMLLHVSLVFFFGGLVAFLLPINRMLMGLIIGVLAIFLILYGVLTLLPIITLDAPYRTPFSHLLWRCIPKIRRNVFSGDATNFAPSNINDAMEVEALLHSEARDQRAFSWTMESLTDDHEFLPFLQAIPEAIHGVKGFYHLNDHLFIPLLNNSGDPLSLKHRITTLLLSCRNMASGDPLCEHRLVAGMKAIWALGMISDVQYHHESTDYSGFFWFDSRSRKAVARPERREGTWPQPYAKAAVTAIDFSRMNNLRHFIASLVRLADRGYHGRITEGLLKVFDSGAYHHLSGTFDSCRNSFREWFARGPRNMNHSVPMTTLKFLADSSVWEEIRLSLLCHYLIDSATNLRNGETLPYQYTETCHKIVPVIPDISGHSVLFDLVVDTFDPGCHAVMVDELLGLDWIMRSVIRLLPSLNRSNVVPILAIYIGRHYSLDAIEFACQPCDVLYLFESLVMAIKHKSPDNDLLHAISAVHLLMEFESQFTKWTAQDQCLWRHMMDNNMFNSPAHASLSTLMTQRRLVQLLHASSNRTEQLGERDELEMVLNLACHPILAFPPAKPGMKQESLEIAVVSKAKQAMIAVLTNFVLNCTNALKPMYMGRTIEAFLAMVPAGGFDDVDLHVMSHFAATWCTLVQYLTENPNDMHLNVAVKKLFLWAGGPVRFFYRKATAPVLMEALTLYSIFLANHHANDHPSRDKTTGAIEALTTRMDEEIDGVS